MNYTYYMKIIFFEVRDKERELLSKLITGHELSFHKEKLTAENIDLAKDADVISVFIDSEIKKEIIDSLPQLKFIATRSTGFDHIDIAYAKEKGIAVASVPSYGANTVAEFAFALILNLSRKISDAGEQMKERASFDISKLQGFDLHGKTLGVIGTGKIGKNVVRIAKGFGMKVIAYDVYPDQAFAKEMEIEYVSLAELLSSSDIVTIHAPYNETTHHLINKGNITLMKRGSLLINTARGEIIDTEALVAALKSGTVAGAALDVLEGERKLKEEAEFLTEGKGNTDDFKLLAEDHALIDMSNVIVTPHIAFFSNEAEAEIIKTTAENISAFISGAPINIVQPK